MRSIPDESTRLAALKRGEVDGIYWVSGELAEELQRTPGLALKAVNTAPFWIYFPEQWDPKSPWHDTRALSKHAECLYRLGRQASRADPRGKPGFWTFESECSRETDSPLE